MNTYSTSTGERLKQSVIDGLIRKAKEAKLRQQVDDAGYNFCENCGISGGMYLDCSHNESVKSCKENGRTERAFDVDNITILCRSCHKIKDKLHVQWKLKSKI